MTMILLIGLVPGILFFFVETNILNKNDTNQFDRFHSVQNSLAQQCKIKERKRVRERTLHRKGHKRGKQAKKQQKRKRDRKGKKRKKC